MYVPIHNRETDRKKILAFMREYPFATFITTHDGAIHATHLPVLIDERDDNLVILAHVARGNVQWRDFENNSQTEALIIFQEPHAFISTRHYERPLSVPTWNYVAVHAYGIPRILTSLQERLQLVKRMVEYYEGNLDQWNSLPEDFRQTKANGIVAFEMPVTRLEARFKLSQDRTRAEQDKIAQSLSHDSDTGRRKIGELVAQSLPKNY